MKAMELLFRASAALFAGALPISLSAPSAAAAQNVPLRAASALMRAIGEIRVQEASLHNITVSASSTLYGQQYDPKKKKWVWCQTPLNKHVMTATFDGTPHGLFCANVPLQWVAGNYGHSRQVYVESFRMAYNGRVSTYLHTAAASVGSTKLFPYNRGWINGKMPVERDIIDGSTAWDDTIFGFTGDQPTLVHQRFSNYIALGQKGVKVTARWKRWRGRIYLQVTRTGPPLGKDVFLLDPRKRFSIARCEEFGWRVRRGPSGRVHLSVANHVGQIVRVSRFLEPLRGVFYPGRVVWKALGPRGVKIGSGEVDVSKVVVNDPHVNASTYVVRFPRGALILDKSTGRYLQIGGTPAQQLKEIEAAVKAAR